ncbi:MAG: glycerol-3-phosphate dehydrogenase/oxidase [Actinomycetota bacterium]|nr:glycerol-3-phosphate dehydrogenase/oxidase [Actinomycetota bacterium]
MALGSFDRPLAAEQLSSTRFDVLVVGGGITGCGVALDAAARGMRTALIERGDLASGTSSRSSKLVHGGLRYLQQREVGLVRDALAERQRLLANARHLVTVQPFLIPVFGSDGLFPRRVARALGGALWMYDLSGGLRIGHRHRRVSAQEAAAQLPCLDPDRLAGAYLYHDARADDARLTLAIARTAALDHGAVVCTRATLTGRDGTTAQVALDDGTGGTTTVTVRAEVVVNAGGVWAEAVESTAGRSTVGRIRPAKGVHATVPADRLPAGAAVVLPVRSDGRSVFVVPWGSHTYIGTTDTAYDGPLDEPTCTAADLDYLLEAVNATTDAGLTAADVSATWAGLRPLVEGDAERTADLSRRHTITAADGMVTVVGGKLTTYRTMAAEAVDAAFELLPPSVRGSVRRRSPTAELRLRGSADPPGRKGDDRDDLLDGLDTRRPPAGDGDLLEHLVGRYGTEARVVLAMIDRDHALGEPLVRGLPYVRAEVAYAARYEQALTVRDVLERRTRARSLDALATAEAADDTAGLLATALGRDDAWATAEAADVRASITAERRAAGLSVPEPLSRDAAT